MSGEQFTGTVLRLPGGSVLLQGQALADVVTALGLVVKTQRRDGFPTPARVLDLVEACSAGLVETARGSADGSAEYRRTPGLPLSTQWVGVPEAAVLLGVSTRRIRVIAEELGGRKVGAAWRFDPDTLQDAARQRRAS